MSTNLKLEKVTFGQMLSILGQTTPIFVPKTEATSWRMSDFAVVCEVPSPTQAITIKEVIKGMSKEANFAVRGIAGFIKGSLATRTWQYRG